MFGTESRNLRWVRHEMDVEVSPWRSDVVKHVAQLGQLIQQSWFTAAS